MSVKKYLRRMSNLDYAHIDVPSVVQNGKLLIRGTDEWEEREKLRRACGCSCLSFGPIPALGGVLAEWRDS
jgi:hypothetical protein